MFHHLMRREARAFAGQPNLFAMLRQDTNAIVLDPQINATATRLRADLHFGLPSLFHKLNGIFQ